MRTEGSLLRPEGGEFSGCDDLWDSFASHDDYLHFTRAWLTECGRILKPHGSLWVIGSMQCIYAIGGVMQELGFWFINDVVWHKSNPTPNFLGTRLNNAHETLLWAAKDKKSKYTFHYKTAKELHSEIVGFDRGERLKNAYGGKLHNTQKPESLLYRIIAISSNLGDVVLDPFGGTMTTAAAAKKLGRHYIMCEQNEEYVKFGQMRLDSVVFEENDIARASYDVKPARVSLGELIASGFLHAGEKLYLKGSALYARLLESGRLRLEGESVGVYMSGDSELSKKSEAGIEGDIHSLAARLKGVKAKRLNGFLYWEVERDSKGNRILLYDVREQYRQGLG